jgi:hypothetical protein
LENQYYDLDIRLDDQEQYSRRTSLRFHNVPCFSLMLSHTDSHILGTSLFIKESSFKMLQISSCMLNPDDMPSYIKQTTRQTKPRRLSYSADDLDKTTLIDDSKVDKILARKPGVT